MTYLLDTDVMIDFFKKRAPATALIKGLSENAQLAVSVLTVTELRAGWSPEQAQRLLPELYAMCLTEVVTQEIAELAGIWRRGYLEQGKPLATPDTIIAATAYRNSYCLVTKNYKDYPMPELKLYHSVYE